MNRYLAAALAALISLPAWAANISVTDAWARTTVPGQKVSGGYFQIMSDVDARLIGVSSAVVPRVEMHEMRMDGGVMRMRELEGLTITAGGRVVLAPGGTHLMLMGLSAPLRVGEKIPVTLRFARGGERTVIFEVREPR